MNKRTLVCFAALSAALASPVLAQEKQEKQGKEKDKPAPAAAAAPVAAEKAGYKLGSLVDENLVLTDLDGKSLSFKDLRGRVVAIHFWSSVCPYEVQADPKVHALEERWKDNKDVVVLAINANASEIGA